MKPFNKNKLFLQVIVSFFCLGVFLTGTKVYANESSNTYTWLTWPNDNYSSFSWDVEPLNDPSPSGIFWSHEFNFESGSQTSADTAYFGIQTEGNTGPDNGDVNVGKIAIFSVWNANSGTPGSGGWGSSFGNEGSGYSVRIQYNWSVDITYQLTVTDLGLDSSSTSWGAYITNTTSGVKSYVGQINVPSNWGGLTGNSGAWTELYTTQPTSCSGVPLAEVDFTNFSANNGSVTPSSSYNTLQSGSVCANSYVMDIPGGVEQIVGAYQPTTPSVNTPAPTTPEPTTTPETIPKSTNQPTTPSVNTPAPTTPEPTTTPETIPKSTNIKPVNSQNLQLTKVVLIALTIMLILSAIFVVFKKLHKSKPILDSPGDDKVNTLYDRSLLSMSQQLKPDGQIEVGGGVEGGIQEPKDEPTHDLTKR